MRIISLAFAALTGAVFLGIRLCNRIAKNDRTRAQTAKWILLAGSFLFVCRADLRFGLVLALLSLVTWFCGKDKKRTKPGILLSLLTLAYFKYTGFFLDSICSLLGKADSPALEILLPLGISFYSFSAVSYLVDVSRGKVAARPLLDVALYLSFFPRLTSGPIQRSEDFFRQTDAPRQVGWNSFSRGIQIFCFGLFKKLVLADRLSVFVDQVYAAPKAFDSLTVLLAMLAYSLQIYFDFSGYSDMAIGAAETLDIHLPRNFNLPYLSHNVTEFWKRWHITLSSWLQDYLYIPLGGNRKGTARMFGNLILTMVLGGIWHGASWSYIVWGLLHGIALAVHKLWAAATGSPSKPHGVLSNALSVLVTFLFTSVCWVFFRAESLSHALAILEQLVFFRSGLRQPYVWFFFAAAVLCVCTCVALSKSWNRRLPGSRQNQSAVDGFYPILDLTSFWGMTLFFVFCGLILGLAYTGGSPFIYGAY